MRILTALLLISAILAAPSCSSGPNIQPEERPTVIHLKDHRNGMDLFLANEAHTSRVDYYSEARTSADMKIVPNLNMGALMQALNDYGYFTAADAGHRRVPGARTTLLVQVGQEKYTLAMTTDSAPSDIQRAIDCNTAFRALYNAEFSWQTIDNPDGRSIFEDQQRQLGSRNTRGF